MRLRCLPTAIATISAIALTNLASPEATADAAPKPELTVSMEGNDLKVVVHGVTDYCSTDADTHVLRTSESIRIVRDRPGRVSRCVASEQERAFIIKDVTPGRYVVTYERMPLVAPARPIRVAWTNAYVPNAAATE